MCRSVPHTPAWRTAMSTSPGPADGFGTVATFRPGARLALRIACIRTWEEGRGKGEASEDRAREAPVHLQHGAGNRSEEHTSELQSLRHLVCRLLLEKKKPDQQASSA